ncbi:MAG: hypothetical protein R3E95_12525 [Thiolinea sp.]
MWLNQHYLKTLPLAEVVEQLQWHLQDQQLDTHQGPALEEVVAAQRERFKSLAELVKGSRYFYEDVTAYDEAAVKKQFRAETADYLQAAHAELKELDTWEDEVIHQAIQRTCEKLDIKLGKLGPALRIAVTGAASSPSLEITLRLIGRERSLERILRAADFIKNRLQDA